MLTPMPVLLVLILISPLAAAQQTITIDRDVCALLTEHEPDADVAFTPGVDVNGNPVAAADLPGSPQLELPDGYAIPIELLIPMAEGIGPEDSALRAKVIAGRVDLVGDDLLFNGQPLETDVETRLRAACREALALD